MLRIRIEDNGPFAAFRWRGVTGEVAAPAQFGVSRRTRRPLRRAFSVLAVRLLVPTEKAQSVRDIGGAVGRPHVALLGGSDVTAFSVPDALPLDAWPGCVMRVGVGSEEGPGDTVIGSGLPADGAEGFGRVLEGLPRASR